MAYENMFDHDEKDTSGKVVVQVHPNPMKKGTYYGKVVRSVADDAAIATAITKQTDVIKFIDVAPVLSGLVRSIKEKLSLGNAVRISGLGTFYLRVNGALKTPTPTAEDLGNLTIGFTTNEKLSLAVKDTEISAIMEVDTNPQISMITDMDKMLDESITAGKSLHITGKYLTTAGEAADNCGVYAVPCTADGSYKADMSDWVRVDNDDIYTNKPSELMVRMPTPLTADKYRIAIRTKSPAAGCKFMPDPTNPRRMIPDPVSFIKAPRLGISEKAYVM